MRRACANFFHIPKTKVSQNDSHFRHYAMPENPLLEPDPGENKESETFRNKMRKYININYSKLKNS